VGVENEADYGPDGEVEACADIRVSIPP